MLSVVMLGVAIFYCYAECHYAECRYAECCGALLADLKSSDDLILSIFVFLVVLVLQIWSNIDPFSSNKIALSSFFALIS